MWCEPYENRHTSTGSADDLPTFADDLARHQRVERRLAWKEAIAVVLIAVVLIAVVLIAVVVVVRQLWLG